MEALDLRYATLEEFENLPENVRAELIHGIIYDMSPAPNITHQRISMRISNLIFNYIKRNKGKCEVYSAPTDVKLSDDTTVQPDIFVVCNPDKLTEKCCVGAPDWIIEITSGNAAYDYVTKLNLYKEFHVREHWVVDPINESVTVCSFENIKPEFNHYKFTDTVTARIFKDNPEPLEICVADLISDY